MTGGNNQSDYQMFGDQTSPILRDAAGNPRFYHQPDVHYSKETAPPRTPRDLAGPEDEFAAQR